MKKLIYTFAIIMLIMASTNQAFSHKIKVWGDNSFAQGGFGVNVPATSKVPTNIASNSPSTDFTAWAYIASGDYHVLAIHNNGTLWGWGKNDAGQLGDANVANKVFPTQIAASTWISVAGGYGHTIAVRSDGTLWGCGYNLYSQVGDGSSINKTSFTQIGTATNWKSVACGEFFSLGLKTDGSLWGWGQNFNGQLGDANTNPKLIPTQIGTDKDWAFIECGGYHSLAIKTDGSLWAWGSNSNGQTNGTSTSNKTAPTQIGTDKDWATATGGLSHSLFIKTNGSLYALGFNNYGQLGDNTTGDKKVLTQIAAGTTFAYVSAGLYHTIAVTTCGALYGWGYNASGQVGDNSTTTRTVPTPIGTNVYWSSVAAGYTHSVAVGVNPSLVVPQVYDVTCTPIGTMTDNAGTTITERGFVWSLSTTSTSPTYTSYTGIWSDANPTSGTTFSYSIPGLACNKTYYIRSFTKNSCGIQYSDDPFTTGTEYGKSTPFNTEKTGIKCFSPYVLSVTPPRNNSIDAYGDCRTGSTSTTSTYSVRGFAWGTVKNAANLVRGGNSTTNTGGGSWEESGNFDAQNSANYSGIFHHVITGPICSNSYFVRPFAYNCVSGTTYGPIEWLTTTITYVAPTCSTAAATSITNTGSVLNGGIIPGPIVPVTNPDGLAGTQCSVRGFAWGTASNPIRGTNTGGGSWEETGTFDVGAFSHAISGLTCNKTYYVRSYVINCAGTSYGAQMTFNTTNVLASLTTNATTAINNISAILNGQINTNDGSVCTSRGFAWSTSPGVATNGGTNPGGGTYIESTGPYNVGSFSRTITGLACNTTYYVRTFGINCTGVSYSTEISFTTTNVSPSVTTESATSISDIGATLNGNITDLGGGTTGAFSRGFVLSQNINPLTAPIGTFNQTAGAYPTGTFSATATALTSNRDYYYVAFVTTCAGTVYGAVQHFKTAVTTTHPPNTENLVLWLDPTDVYGGVSAEPGDGTKIASWTDKTTPQENAEMSDLGRQPTLKRSPNGIGSQAAILFEPDNTSYGYGLSDVLVSPNNPEIMTTNTDLWNPIDQKDKSLFVLFKTAATQKNPAYYESADGRQCIFEAGGPLSGYNIYITNGMLCFGMWNRFQRAYVRLDATGIAPLYPLRSDAIYIAQLEFNSATNEFRALVSGFLENQTTPSMIAISSPWYSFNGLSNDPDSPSEGTGVGAASRTSYHDYNIGSTYSNHFNGLMGDIMLYNDLIKTSPTNTEFKQKVQDIYDYLAAKYTISDYIFGKHSFSEEGSWNIQQSTDYDLNDYSLSQAYPNPFVEKSSFGINMPNKQYVTVELFDAIGNKIQSIFSGELSAGIHDFEISGANLTNGMYMFKMTGDGFVKSGKVVLMK